MILFLVPNTWRSGSVLLVGRVQLPAATGRSRLSSKHHRVNPERGLIGQPCTSTSQQVTNKRPKVAVSTIKDAASVPRHSHHTAGTPGYWHPLKQRLKFFTSPYDADIISLAAPAVLALAADPLLGIVDTAFVGKLGEDNLVSDSPCNSLQERSR